VARFGGKVPAEVDVLLTLPGVGRYTAGAIASIVFGRAEPIVEGNVARVLMRVEGRDLDPARGARWAWGRAAELVGQSARLRAPSAASRGVGPGAFNEGLMELGAVLCTPRGARCGDCPLRFECRALASGAVDRVPRPKPRAARRALFCAAVVLEDEAGRVLLERRADGGMWGGLWQAPTLEGRRRATRREVQEWVGVRDLVRVGRFSHGTTHRHAQFDVWRGSGGLARAGGVWKSRDELPGLALSNAQRRILWSMVPGAVRK